MGFLGLKGRVLASMTQAACGYIATAKVICRVMADIYSTVAECVS